MFGTSAQIGRQIKQRIRTELHLIASVGVAPNKFLAKIASDLHKPDGFVVVDPGEVREFLDPLPVGRIWGVGKVTGQVFGRLGIRTIGELRRLSVETSGSATPVVGLVRLAASRATAAWWRRRRQRLVPYGMP